MEYDRITLQFPKDKEQELKAYAKSEGLSLNALIKRCIEECSGIDFNSDSETDSN